MRPSDVRVGQRVTCPMDGPDVGTVERHDEHNGIVYVRFPIPGHPGKTDLMDIDPADLVPAS